MCGICGVMGQAPDVSGSVVRRMADAMRHRGPDADGFLVVQFVALGIRRLRIIDLATGDQPIFNEDRTVAIVFNGEVYNYQQLTRELQARGHSFATRTDTEAVVHAYEEWGQTCVQRLRGMFAFAIYDNRPTSQAPIAGSQSPTLFLARDRLGIKPLYYYSSGRQFLFASEVRALLASGLVLRRLDLHGLRSYLAYGSVQEPLTLVAGVRSLLPGHTMSVQLAEGGVQTTIECYWRLPGPEAVQATAPPDVTDQLRERLSEAVRLRLIAEVPLGAFLSGGIDSTAVVALMKRTGDAPVRTFSVVFAEAEYDERRYSRRAAEKIGTEHTELLLTGNHVRAELPRALAAFDQPSLDGINTYFVSKVAREAGLTVSLSGVGGDELFGGYGGYNRTLRTERWGHCLQSIPSCIRHPLADFLTVAFVSELMRKVAEVLRSEHHPYFVSRLLFNTFQVSTLLRPDLFAASRDWEPPSFSRLLEATAGFDSINRASALELQTYMVSTLLRDTDQMSMAHSLEVRVPLIDHKVVEYVFSLPGACKVHPTHPKPLLTAALDGAIPPECIYRPKKGFDLPFEVWLRQALLPTIQRGFTQPSDTAALLFARGGLAGIWQQFATGRVNWSRVWTLFVLCQWLEQQQINID